MAKVNLETFIRDYTITALWSSTDEYGDPLDAMFYASDLSPEAQEKIQQDCALFLWSLPYWVTVLLEEADHSLLAHDFWLTRCGHGAGFWDGDWRDDIGECLTKRASSFGNVDIYEGDDCLLYLI